MAGNTVFSGKTDDKFIDFSRSNTITLYVRLFGDWTLINRPPSSDIIQEHIAGEPALRILQLDGVGLGSWDSALISFLVTAQKVCDANSIKFDVDQLPEGVEKLLKLALAVPEKAGARRAVAKPLPLLDRLGRGWLALVTGANDVITFIGEVLLSFGRLLSGRARMRRFDLLLLMQECGVQALPIVSLIAILVGLILAFVGAVQLQQFGAEVFVANLVAIASAREMGAMMTAIIMAGRTGAAFAAQIGTMQVNEEVDALQTLGIPPMDFLVLPRMTALLLMMPLLSLYAVLLGMAGGAIVGIGMLGISPIQYYNQTVAAVGLSDFTVGLVKAGVFGVIIAVAGCMCGMRCGRSAAAVGTAATSAVVAAIVAIVVADGLFAILTNILGV